MDYFGRLSTKNSFGIGIADTYASKNINIINIVCGVLLIILIIILIVSLINNNDGFSDKNNENETHLFLVIRKDGGCGFAKKAHDLFKENGMVLNGIPVKAIDISETEKYLGKQLAQQVQGTPIVVCTKSGKTSTGHKSLEEHAKAVGIVTGSKSNDDNNGNSNKDIILVGTNTCPFCVKAKDLLDTVVGKDNYEFVDSNSKEGKNHLQHHNMNGVPLTITKNGKVVKGFNKDELETIHL